MVVVVVVVVGLVVVGVEGMFGVIKLDGPSILLLSDIIMRLINAISYWINAVRMLSCVDDVRFSFPNFFLQVMRYRNATKWVVKVANFIDKYL